MSHAKVRHGARGLQNVRSHWAAPLCFEDNRRRHRSWKERDICPSEWYGSIQKPGACGIGAIITLPLVEVYLQPLF